MRKPRVLCQKHGATCMTYYPLVQRYEEMGQEIGFLCSQERRKESSKWVKN
jgi:hypothetical protein